MKLSLLTFILVVLNISNLITAEAGMPQLDSKYWLSQSFWLILIFAILYFSIANFFIPKIKDNLDNRENKIKDDLDGAKELSLTAEEKNVEYLNEINAAKKEVAKILIDSKKQLDKSLQQKKELFEKDLEKKILKTEKEINDMKKNSYQSIKDMSAEISGKIIEDITGDKLNQSSVDAAITEISRDKISKYL
jgi:F-type H+-transporting ATPase subunit b